MRLLHWINNWDDRDSGAFSLVERVGYDIPPCIILSHTWGQDEDEVTYKHIMKGRGREKPGYAKLIFARRKAGVFRLRYLWIDTLSIDNSSSAGLSEAINSMYKWYREATMCVTLS